MWGVAEINIYEKKSQNLQVNQLINHPMNQSKNCYMDLIEGR